MPRLKKKHTACVPYSRDNKLCKGLSIIYGDLATDFAVNNIFNPIYCGWFYAYSRHRWVRRPRHSLSYLKQPSIHIMSSSIQSACESLLVHIVA